MLSDSATQLLRELQGVSWIPTYNVCTPLVCPMETDLPRGRPNMSDDGKHMAWPRACTCTEVVICVMMVCSVGQGFLVSCLYICIQCS